MSDASIEIVRPNEPGEPPVAPLPRIAVTIEQAAACVGLSAELIGAMIRENRFPHVRVGRRVLIPLRALEEWLHKQAVASVGDARVVRSDGQPTVAHESF